MGSNDWNGDYENNDDDDDTSGEGDGGDGDDNDDIGCKMSLQRNFSCSGCAHKTYGTQSRKDPIWPFSLQLTI